MHEKIVAAKKKLRAAQKHLDETLDRVQAECAHEKVVERPYQEGNYFGSLLPRRICIDCGYEEESWSWPGHVTMINVHGTRIGKDCREGPIRHTKLNADFVKRVSTCDEFYKYRP